MNPSPGQIRRVTTGIRPGMFYTVLEKIEDWNFSTTLWSVLLPTGEVASWTEDSIECDELITLEGR